MTNGSGSRTLFWFMSEPKFAIGPNRIKVIWEILISVFWDGTKIMFDRNIKKILHVSAFGCKKPCMAKKVMVSVGGES